jgi:PAS domain S-box-containing protein
MIFSLEQVQGQSIYPLVVEEHRAARQALTKRVFQGESGVLEFEMVGLKGTHRWLETHTVPLRNENQTIIALLEVTRDITKRKQAEQLLGDYNRTLEQQVAERTAALQQSQAELREREQELRLITDALPVCIIYVDANQRYRFVNRTYEDWFHRSQGEILGKHICENLGEASYQVAKPYINRALAGEITTYEAEIPCVFGKKYISSSLIPDFDDNRTSPFKVVKFGTKIGHFNIQKAQNLSGGFKMVALKQRIFVGHLERAGPIILALDKKTRKIVGVYISERSEDGARGLCSGERGGG